MTHTKKKSSPVNVVDSAWEAFFTERVPKTRDMEELRKEGWMPFYEFEERTGLSNTTARNMAKREGLEVQKFFVDCGNQRRHIKFVRIPV